MYSPYPSMPMEGAHQAPYGAPAAGGFPHQYNHHMAQQQHHRAFLQHHHQMMMMHGGGGPSMYPGTFSTPIQRQRTATGNTPSSRTVATSWCPPHVATNGHSQMMMPSVSPGGNQTNFKYTAVQPPAPLSAARAAAGSASPAAAGGLSSAFPTMSAATAATTTSLADKANPMSGKSLERELTFASKEELIQVLLDLSSCNADASRFIHSKAQLFALHTTASHNHNDNNLDGCRNGTAASAADAPDTALAVRQTTTTAVAPHPTTACQHHDALLTPSKELFAMNDSTGSWQSRSASKDQHHGSHQHDVLAAPPTPTAVGGVAQPHHHEPSPIRRELQNRHVTPEVRAFSTDVHPCLRLYGACRHTVNCIFKTLPRNLCLNWVRGSCAGGADCGCVHRFPNNCPAQVHMVFELSHGGDRAGMAKRAEAFLKTATSTPEPSLNNSARANLYETASPIRAPHEDDHDDEISTTPRDDNQRASIVLSRRLLNSHATSDDDDDAPSAAQSDVENHNGSVAVPVVSRCLNDSFEKAAAE